MPASTLLRQGDNLSRKATELLTLEDKYSAGGFGPLPGFVVSAKGSTLKVRPESRPLQPANYRSDPFQTNIAVHDHQWPILAKTLCEKLGYDKVASMTSGAEAADAAVKIARKWGIVRKGIPAEELLVLGCSENYHGLSSGIWPLMTPGCGQQEYGITSVNNVNFDPETGKTLRYGHVEDFEEVFEKYHGRIAAVMMEPIHGGLETFQEEIDFAAGVRQLCKKHNALFIADEVRMGSGKTGKFLCSDWLGSDNKPDMVVLGKSISGGAFPASYVLGYNDTMTLVRPNQSASTYAMSPAANASTLAALCLYADPNLLDRARVIQEKWREITSRWNYPFLRYCTGRGADLVIVLNEGEGGVTARRIARLAYQYGTLVYPQKPRIRCSVSLTITDEELQKGMDNLSRAMADVSLYGDIPGDFHPVDEVDAGF
ncbi:pyridoxal phosphate-dependent transferase [Microdochium bolleyi]|uniref:Ornithine aminotransferase n=1 Tax=Microdochium bolleyi TaxID=196109 RepID=A0A136IQJ0_9PEZI|nr:pyridoxal phosphate-dependent transferase [Microdochium bolleyi]